MDAMQSLAIAGRVNATIHDVLDCDRDDITLHATMDDLNADSLDVSEVVGLLAEEYGIELDRFDDMDYEQLMGATIGTVDVVTARRAHVSASTFSS